MIRAHKKLILAFIVFLALFTYIRADAHHQQIFAKGSDDSGSSGGDSGTNGSSSGSSNSTNFNTGSNSSSSDSTASNISNSGSSGSSDGSGETKTIVKSSPKPTVTRVKTETETEKTEIRQKDQETEIKTVVKSGALKTATKVKFEFKDDRPVVKVETEQGEEEIENEVENESVEVAETEVQAENDSLVLKKGGVSARTTIPVTIDREAGTLSVTTPSGNQILRILPDQALNKITNEGLLDPTNETNLEFENGALVYKITGTKSERLLGLFPVDLEKTVSLSADTNEIANITEDLTTRILDAISF